MTPSVPILQDMVLDCFRVVRDEFLRDRIDRIFLLHRRSGVLSLSLSDPVVFSRSVSRRKILGTILGRERICISGYI